MSEQFPRNRKPSDTFNSSYNSNKLSHPINSSAYYEAGKPNYPLNQPPDVEYKAGSYLTNRQQDIYLDQSILNTYNQNTPIKNLQSNYYDEFNTQRNSQNYSDYP